MGRAVWTNLFPQFLHTELVCKWVVWSKHLYSNIWTHSPPALCVWLWWRGILVEVLSVLRMSRGLSTRATWVFICDRCQPGSGNCRQYYCSAYWTYKWACLRVAYRNTWRINKGNREESPKEGRKEGRMGGNKWLCELKWWIAKCNLILVQTESRSADGLLLRSVHCSPLIDWIRVNVIRKYKLNNFLCFRSIIETDQWNHVRRETNRTLPWSCISLLPGNLIH
jgi:hypothetical protein